MDKVINSKKIKQIETIDKIRISPDAFWNSIELYGVLGGRPTKQYSSYTQSDFKSTYSGGCDQD